MKKISVNGKFFCQQITGTQRYAREVLNQLDRLLSTEDKGKIAIEILVPQNGRQVPRYKNLQVRVVGKLNGIAWEQFELPLYCKRKVLLTLSGGAPVLHACNVVTIHDAAVFAAPAGYSLLYRLCYRNLCRQMGRTAKHILTVSNFSKSEIVKWYGADPAKVSVAYCGSEHFSRLEADNLTLARFGIQGKYILAASSHNPNKNFRRLVEAIRHHFIGAPQLVIAGGNDSRIYRESMELPDAVRVLGYVSDSELKALYQNAACFVFPSLYEGFGLPPLEAMTCGCPTVVSQTASLPEIFEGAAFFCNPYSPKDIAAAIQRAIDVPVPDADQLKTFARKFSWETCARETLEVLRNV